MVLLYIDVKFEEKLTCGLENCGEEFNKFSAVIHGSLKIEFFIGSFYPK